ncbi:hypothetical protein FRC03_009852 [Tulasnella sp. 419]|nr:hypothetical protein FRC03_009852 [Tulasnella sp. 419]
MASRPLVIPENEKLPQDVEDWSKNNVQEFLEANKDIRHLEVNDIHTLNENGVTGEVLLGLTKEKLGTKYGLKLGPATVFAKIVEQLKVVKGIGQPPTEAAISSILVGSGGTTVAGQKRPAKDELDTNQNANKTSAQARPMLKIKKIKMIGPEDLKENDIVRKELFDGQNLLAATNNDLPSSIQGHYNRLMRKVPLKRGWLTPPTQHSNTVVDTNADVDPSQKINHLQSTTLLLQELLGKDVFDQHFEEVNSPKEEDLPDLTQLISYLNAAYRHQGKTSGFSQVNQYTALAKEAAFTAIVVDPALDILGKHYQRNNITCTAFYVDECGDTFEWEPRNDFQVTYGQDPVDKYALLHGEADSKGESEAHAMYKMALLAKRSLEILSELYRSQDRWVLCSYVSEPKCTMYLFYKDETQGRKYVMRQIVRFTNTFFDKSQAVGYLRILHNFAAVAPRSTIPNPDDMVQIALRRQIGYKREEGRSTSKKKRKTSENTGGGQSEPPTTHNLSVEPLTIVYSDITPMTNYPSIFVVKSVTTNKIYVAKWTTRDREAQLLRSLQSTKHARYRNHVVELIEIIQGNNGAFIVMPRHSPLTSLRNLSSSCYHTLRYQLVEGVAFLHAQNVAHCDLKPDNILVESAREPVGTLVITDFGNACYYRPGYLCKGYHGTRGWTAPEVSDDTEWDPLKADVWATAKTLLHLAEVANYRDVDMTRIVSQHNPSTRPSIAEVFDSLFSSW